MRLILAAPVVSSIALLLPKLQLKAPCHAGEALWVVPEAVAPVLGHTGSGGLVCTQHQTCGPMATCRSLSVSASEHVKMKFYNFLSWARPYQQAH